MWLIFMIIVLLILLFLTILLLYNKYIVDFLYTGSIDLVIARSNKDEDISFLDNINQNLYRRIIVYNKGSYLHKTINIPNVGGSAHTFLHYIIKYYNDLADVTIFLSLNASDINIAQPTIDKSFLTHDSVFFVNTNQYDIQSNLVEYIQSYQNDNLFLCKDRPYNNWYDKNFNDTYINSIVLLRSNIFSVSRNHIHNRPIEFYKRLLGYIDTHQNPEAMYFIDRSWLAIFDPIPDHCVYKLT